MGHSLVDFITVLIYVALIVWIVQSFLLHKTARILNILFSITFGIGSGSRATKKSFNNFFFVHREDLSLKILSSKDHLKSHAEYLSIHNSIVFCSAKCSVWPMTCMNIERALNWNQKKYNSSNFPWNRWNLQ